MIIWGSCQQESTEATGDFHCPNCQASQLYMLVRRWDYFTLYFIPLFKQRLISEVIVCGRCSARYSIAVLAGTSDAAVSLAPVSEGSVGFAESFRNVVEFTDAAIAEIKRRHAAGKFGADSVVRVDLSGKNSDKVIVTFDYALADGDDLLGKSHGIPVIVDRRVAPLLEGYTIDFREGGFVRSS